MAVVYFPEQNRVEAIGGLTRKSKAGDVNADRAEITIDLARERKQDAKPEQKTLQIPTTKKNSKAQPKSQPKKKTSTSTRRTRRK